MHFDHLLPEIIFKSIEEQGYFPTGRLVPLNSYENRVYEIGVEDDESGKPNSLVVKYYRPGRWNAQTIAEEHKFVAALAEVEIPVVSHLPLECPLKEVVSLAKTDGGIFYAFFPKFRGREHAEITNDDRRWLGRHLARLHNVGATFDSRHRLHLTPETYGWSSLEFILTQEFLPTDLRQNIELQLETVLELVEPFFSEDWETIALHGDCHPGNILWNKEGPHLLDFDDMVIAPAIQDLWMLFHGSEEEKREQQKVFFEGYETFRKFDQSSLVLAEPLRTLRMIHYSAWIGQRYTEPAFQKAFPYYQERRYWEDFLQSIREQISLLQELE